MKFILFASLAFLLLNASCAHRGVKVIPIYSAEEEFGRAKRLLEHKKYDEAATAFDQFVYNHGGSARVPDAVYLQGESRFLSRAYSDAIAPFEKVVTEYPASAFADRAQYRLGLCYLRESPSWELDQEMTEKAIETFQVFLIKYPQSNLIPEVNKMIAACLDKLSRKRFDAGRIYLKLRLYNSARLYFNSTIHDYPDFTWARRAALGLAECDFLEKKYTEAQIGFEALLKDPDEGIRKKAEARLKDITKNTQNKR